MNIPGLEEADPVHDLPLEDLMEMAEHLADTLRPLSTSDRMTVMLNALTRAHDQYPPLLVELGELARFTCEVATKRAIEFGGQIEREKKAPH